MKGALATAQAESNKAQDQLTLPQQKYDTLAFYLDKGYSKVHENWKTWKYADVPRR